MAAVILLVEDNPVTLRAVRAILEDRGYEVLTASSGLSAIELASRQTPDLVLLDLYLPDMHGFDLLTRLKLRFGKNDVPILAFSGLLAHVDEARALQLGFAGFLHKPVETEVLLETIQTHLADPRVRAPREQQRVLLADDNEVSLSLQERQLKKMGFEVVVAHDGVHALQLARSRTPDAIVTDALMPRMDGFRLCQEVRLDPKLCHLPVVIHSASYDEDADRNLAMAMGADAFVADKPKNSGNIAEALCSAMGRTEVASPPKVEEVNRVHADRLLRQLDRQVAMNAYLTRHCAIQTVGLNVVERVAARLRGTPSMEALSDDILASCVDAVGTSHGALFLLESNHQLKLRSQIGYGGSVAANLATFFGNMAWLEQVMLAAEPIILPGADMGGDIAHRVLEGLQVNSLLLIPLIGGDELQGILALGSEKGEQDLLVPARAVGIQVGQALALSAAMSRMAESERRTRLIANSMAEGLLGIDRDGTCRFVNAAVLAMLGYRSDDLMGHRLHDRIHHTKADGQPCQDADCPLFQMVMRGENCRIPEVLWKRDGTTLEVEFASSPIVERGQTIGAVITVADLTDRKRVEREMHETAQKLRQTEERLLQSQKMDALGVLAGGIAHDFNNLLTAIHGYCELLLNRTDRSDKRYEFLEEINNAGERASALTRQLLTFSRREVLDMRSLSLNEAVTNVEKLLGRTIGEDILLVVRLASDLGLICSDMGQIEQVLMNLVVNARDAMPRGGTVTLATANVHLSARDGSLDLDPGPYVVLHVSDTGCGIPAALVQQIFEPFFTTKERGRGTGLGLSTIYGIVKQSRGAIAVKSEVGEGTTFSLYFPRVPGQRAEIPSRAASASAWVGGGETILLVEDDEQVRLLARRVLETCGYRLLEARDGPQALQLIETHPVDLVLTDTIMPKMSGRELVERIREGHTSIKALYMSGYTDDAVVRHGLQLESVDFLQKPFTPDRLTRKVREVLDA